ncbi:MAG: hypothetical protein ACPL1D_01200 [Microgenomates group bacterium]
MIGNYTPIDVEKLKGENNTLVTILLLIAVITLSVLVVILFLLIQKKIKENQIQDYQKENVSTVAPTPTLTPVLTPENQPTALPTETIIVTPTPSTGSSLLNQESQLSPSLTPQSTESSQVNQNEP